MYILAVIIFILILVFVRLDYVKTNREQRRCPKCNNIVKQKFDLKSSNKQFSISSESGQKSNVTIYKCENCEFTWNHTYEIEENAT
jgi:hypothetical protein